MGGGGRGGMAVGPCSVCEAVSSLICGGCGDVYYCCRDHQKKHWPKHRPLCKSFKEVTDPKLGRYIVASRRLKAGQQVLEDQPMGYGPLAFCSLICIGCHGPVPGDFPRCPGCYWPLCSIGCATSSLHKEECPILARDTKHLGVPQIHGETPLYEVVLVLRILLLRSSKPKFWEVLMAMEHHSEKRKEEEKHELQHIVHLIKDVYGLDFTEEEVERVRGAIATNAMQITSPGGIHLRVLHPTVHLFNHSCIPNLQLSFTDDAVMIVRTAVPLEPGDPMYVTYTGTTMPLWERREILRDNYFFTCECTRCSDPTEMGTDFSNPRCSECSLNLMKPHAWLDNIIWVCSNCKTEKTEQRVREEVQASLSGLEMVDVVEGSSYNRLLYLLEQVEQEYHPQHYVWMKVAQMMLHKLKDGTTQKELKIRVAIWKKMSVFYGKLEPGLTRRRGMSLLEMGLSMMWEIKNEYETNSIYIPSLKEQLRLVIGYFQEAVDILSLEPTKVRVHILAERAKHRKEEACELLKEMEDEESLARETVRRD